MKGPKVLLLDIETAPLLVKVWSLIGNNYIPHDRIVKDWAIVAWAAKWLDGEMYYQDNRKKKDFRDDEDSLKAIYDMLQEADIVITQNGRFFDIPKLKARFSKHKWKPLGPFKHFDTKYVAKKHFGLTSYSLAYMSDFFSLPIKKLSHKRFPGNDLWDECEKGNLTAWKEMEKYNKHDVLALECLYKAISPWDNSLNFNLYTDDLTSKCNCGNIRLIRCGFKYLNGGKYQVYQCTSCGAKRRSSKNLLSKEKKASLLHD